MKSAEDLLKDAPEVMNETQFSKRIVEMLLRLRVYEWEPKVYYSINLATRTRDYRTNADNSTIYMRSAGLCPICALYYIRTGKELMNSEASAAFTELDITHDEGITIMNAADDATNLRRPHLLQILGVEK